MLRTRVDWEQAVPSQGDPHFNCHQANGHQANWLTATLPLPHLDTLPWTMCYVNTKPACQDRAITSAVARWSRCPAWESGLSAELGLRPHTIDAAGVSQQVRSILGTRARNFGLDVWASARARHTIHTSMSRRLKTPAQQGGTCTCSFVHQRAGDICETCCPRTGRHAEYARTWCVWMYVRPWGPAAEAGSGAVGRVSPHPTPPHPTPRGAGHRFLFPRTTLRPILRRT